MPWGNKSVEELRENFLDLCQWNEKLTEHLYKGVDWQSPETLYCEMDEDELSEFALSDKDFNEACQSWVTFANFMNPELKIETGSFKTAAGTEKLNEIYIDFKGDVAQVPEGEKDFYLVVNDYNDECGRLYLSKRAVFEDLNKSVLEDRCTQCGIKRYQTIPLPYQDELFNVEQFASIYKKNNIKEDRAAPAPPTLSDVSSECRNASGGRACAFAKEAAGRGDVAL